MHEFELINKYFSKLSKNNIGSLRLNDDVFFDKSKNLIISIDTYIQGTHFINFQSYNGKADNSIHEEEGYYFTVNDDFYNMIMKL